MRNREREALLSLHNIVKALAGILHKLSERKKPEQEITEFLESFESLKEYFEKLPLEDSLSGQDFGIDALSNKMHLEQDY